VVANVKEILAVSKHTGYKFNVEKFKPRKLNELEVREHYQINIRNRFVTLDNFK